MKIPALLKKKRVLVPLGTLLLGALGVANPGPIVNAAAVAVDALKGNAPAE